MEPKRLTNKKGPIILWTRKNNSSYRYSQWQQGDFDLDGHALIGN